MITDALEKVIYPGTKKNLIESEMLADTPSINGNKVKITLIFPRETDPFLKSTLKAAEAQIHYSVGKDVEVTIETEFKSAPRPEVGKVFNARFVNLKLDMEKGEGPEVAKRYSISAYPTMLVINPDGTVAGKVVGSLPMEKILEEMEKIPTAPQQ